MNLKFIEKQRRDARHSSSGFTRTLLNRKMNYTLLEDKDPVNVELLQKTHVKNEKEAVMHYHELMFSMMRNR